MHYSILAYGVKWKQPRSIDNIFSRSTSNSRPAHAPTKLVLSTTLLKSAQISASFLMYGMPTHSFS